MPKHDDFENDPLVKWWRKYGNYVLAILFVALVAVTSYFVLIVPLVVR